MPSSRIVSLVAIVLIVAQLVVRGWLAATGGFYWDDLVLIGRASSQPILSWDYLGAEHDGHFMPAAFLVAGIATVIAPVEWIVPAISLIVLQALASLAVWRMIRTIVSAPTGTASTGTTRSDTTRSDTAPTGTASGRGAAAALGGLAALAFYLFTPMTMTAFAWWAAALNTLPMQAAMAWIVADAVLLCRGDRSDRARRWIVIRSALVFVVALTFFEKSLFILPVAIVAAALVTRFVPGRERRRDEDGPVPHSPLTVAFVRARPLWTVLSVIFVAWLLIYLTVADPAAGNHSITQTLRLIWRSIDSALIPSFVGGPWSWERWIPSPPAGIPPLWMVVAGWLVLVALVWWSVRHRVGAATVIVCTALYVVVAQIPVMWHRSSPNTALELAQTMRYLPDSALVITIAIALIAASPTRVRRVPDSNTGPAADRDTESAAAPGTDSGSDAATSVARHASTAGDPVDRGAISPRTAVAVVVATLVVASSMISLASFASAWRDSPTGPYLAAAKRSLAANKDHPMFDQSLPLEVLLPVTYPNNQISHTFGRVRDRPPFGDSTDRLMMLDNTGELVPGAVTQRRTVAAGRGSCGRPEVDGPAALPLDGPLLDWRWTVQLPYCATADGAVEMSLTGGPPVRVPVRAGLHVVYVQLDGRGTEIRISPVTPGLAVHTGAGRVGEVVYAQLLGEG